MRNVCLAFLVAAGLSLSTACSFSSSRSWGSGNSATPSSTSTGKPARHTSSKGKPARQVPQAAPAPADPKPVQPKATEPAAEPTTPAAPTEPTRVGRENTEPGRVGRENTEPASTTSPSTTIGAKSAGPAPTPGSKLLLGGGTGSTSKPGPDGGAGPSDIKAAPVKPVPRPQPPANKVAPAP